MKTVTTTTACLLSLLALPAIAQTAVYDETSRNLTIPTIRLGLTTFTNLVLRLDAVGIVSVDPAPSTVTEKCAKSNFHADKYNAIVPGMTLAQVSQLMGCKPNASKTERSALRYTTYQWTDDTDTYAYLDTSMQIYFDTDGVLVKVLVIGTTTFPYRSGKGF